MAKKMRSWNSAESHAKAASVESVVTERLPETIPEQTVAPESISPEMIVNVATAPSDGASHASTHTPKETSEKRGSQQIVTRFPAELAARLDRFLGSIRNERFGIRVSRADAVRILVHERLSQLELQGEWPETLSHEGTAYVSTQKTGTALANGLPSRMYESKGGARVWRDSLGAVRVE